MKRLLFIPFLLWASLAQAYHPGLVGVIGRQAASGGGASTTYVGWDNSDGVPVETPSSGTGGTNAIFTTKWTATEGGEAKSVNAYIADNPTGEEIVQVCVYKDISGTITLIGKGLYSGSYPGWTGMVTLIAEPGQSLDFSSGDIIYFGISVYSYNSSPVTFGREDTGGSGMYYMYEEVTVAGLPSTTTLYYSSERKMAIILGYN